MSYTVPENTRINAMHDLSINYFQECLLICVLDEPVITHIFLVSCQRKTAMNSGNLKSCTVAMSIKKDPVRRIEVYENKTISS